MINSEFTATYKRIRKHAFYSFCGLPLVRQYFKQWQGPAIILCFHRILPEKVVEASQGPERELALSDRRFTEIIRYLSDNYHLVSLDGLVAHVQSGQTDPVVCITFDDGYIDNYHCALPVLERYDAPAAIYITTRFPQKDGWMWWYELWERVITQERVSVDYDGEFRAWTCLSDSMRKECYYDLVAMIRGIPLEQQHAFMKALTGSEIRKDYSEYCLDWSEIRAIDKHELITIGAHTHSHSNLNIETDDVVRKEIMSSKQILEKVLGHSIEHFSYPFGIRNNRVVEIVKECGFKTAVTTGCGKVDKMRLTEMPRFIISEDNSPNILAARIGGICNMFGKPFGP